MDTIDRDDVIYAINQTLAFYGKSADALASKFWIRALRAYPAESIKRALADYTAVGKYAPKPRDIIELLDLNRSSDRAHLPPPPKVETKCPPEIAQAWIWFIGRISKGSENFGGFFEDSGDVDTATQEKYLHIVNHEARKYDQPESIPDEYKLAEVWG